jgi:hypothetical protein
MPNWVYNHLSVVGEKKDLLAFAEKARQEHETLWITSEWKFDEALGKNVKTPENERVITPEMSGESVISFWNFIRPTDEELPYYFGHKVKPEDEDDPNATSEQKLAKAMTFGGSDAYDWNVRNWGTKWDAGSAELEENLDDLKDKDTLTYRYETAWSIPEPFMVAMVEQHPELIFDFECEEEQGWGATFDGRDGKLSLTKEWDIPQSHADWVDLGREDSCVCGWSDDETYDDCPTARKPFRVVVQYAYNVSAQDEDTARQIVEKGLTPPTFATDDPEIAHFADESVSVVLTDNGEDEIDLDE